jgi:hypothetical protein
MSALTPRRIAVSMCGLSLLVVGVWLVLFVLYWTLPDGERDLGQSMFEYWVSNAPIFWLPVVGALLTARVPGNPIGWLLSAAGFFYAVGSASDIYLRHTIARGADAPFQDFAGWVNQFSFGFMFPVLATFVPLLFPTGRLPSRRWRIAGWMAGAGIALFTIGSAFSLDTYDGYAGINNPLHVDALEPLMTGVTVGGVVLIGVGAVVSAASLVVRFRRSRGAERQQIKWVALVAALGITAAVTGLTLEGLGLDTVAPGFLGAAVVAATIGLPAGLALAILRYRLYDIDRLINRTLVYVLLSAALAGTYLVGVLGLGSLLRAISGESSSLATAGSTLAVAALFQPLRSRIQHVVDRRFNRSRYDAARTLDRFATRLRDEIDLATLDRQLQAVVRETMQPAHVSLWLRSVGRTGEEIGR